MRQASRLTLANHDHSVRGRLVAVDATLVNDDHVGIRKSLGRIFLMFEFMAAIRAFRVRASFEAAAAWTIRQMAFQFFYKP